MSLERFPLSPIKAERARRKKGVRKGLGRPSGFDAAGGRGVRARVRGPEKPTSAPTNNYPHYPISRSYHLTTSPLCRWLRCGPGAAARYITDSSDSRSLCIYICPFPFAAYKYAPDSRSPMRLSFYGEVESEGETGKREADVYKKCAECFWYTFFEDRSVFLMYSRRVWEFIHVFLLCRHCQMLFVFFFKF